MNKRFAERKATRMPLGDTMASTSRFCVPTATFPLTRSALFALFIIAVSCRLANAQCPAFGADTTCGVVITITNTSSGTLQASVTLTGQGPYDSIEDTLVGVINNSNTPITALGLQSSLDIFGFDGDGIDTYGAPGNAKDTTGYGGPNAYFTSPGSPPVSTVNFIMPITAGKGSCTGAVGEACTAYFSLEESLSGVTPCSSIINNAIPATPTLSGGTLISGFATIQSIFTPNSGLTVLQAAQLCGFVDFDWKQTVTATPDPSPFSAENLTVTPIIATVGGQSIPVRLGGSFDVSGMPVHLTSKKAPYSDPPQGGGYTYENPPPDYSYPFYCDPTGQDSGVNGACPRTQITLSFKDTPSDPCISGPLGIPSVAYLSSSTIRALCGNSRTKGRPSNAYTTHLAGVKSDGTAFDLGIGYTWTSNFNGTSGGIATTKNSGNPDPGSGTGGITVIRTSLTTNYQYPNGVGVVAVNGIPLTTSSASTSTLLTGDQISMTASGLAYSRLTQTFNGTVTIANISTAPINGPFQLVLNSLANGVTVTNPSGSFGGFPFVTVPTSGSLAPGQSASVKVEFKNPSNASINFTPVTYSGSFN